MNVFEQPWLLLIVAGVIFLAVAIFHDALPPKRAWAFWLLPIVIAAAAFGLDYFVQTDREMIKSALDKACRAVETENINALQPLMSNGYRDSAHLSREALLGYFSARLDEPIIEKIVPAIVSLDINPPTAKLVFTARVMFDQRGQVYEYMKEMVFKLEADLTKEGGKWLFSRVEITSINFQPAGWNNTQGNPEGLL